LIRGYFGWLGTHAAMTVDLMAQPFSDVEKPTRKLSDMFVVWGFRAGSAGRPVALRRGLLQAGEARV
jgi:hypothetical protein